MAAAMRTLPDDASRGGPKGTNAGATTAKGATGAAFGKLSTTAGAGGDAVDGDAVDGDGTTAGIFGAERTRVAVDDGASRGRGTANRDELAGEGRREAARACEALAIGTDGRGGGST